jgi:glutamate-1-semialdehyde 2,1-aminomutase
MTHYDRASRVIPGASLTRSKAPGRFYPVGTGPHYAVRGHGPYLVCEDGAELIDMLCALGAISLGYGMTPHAAKRAIEDGALYSLPSLLEAEAAELLLRLVAPWAEQVRFVKTGSEATHAAYRIAKHATGRAVVLMADSGYHGWHEWCQRDGNGQPESPFTAFYPYGCYLPAWMDQHRLEPGDIAAVFVEPHRWEPTEYDWLAQMRDEAHGMGALFVLDEMIYGGRWAVGGASEFFGVVPDLACYGKAIGNGAAIAAVVGPADLLLAHGQMVSGTYSGETVGLGALVDTLGVYEREPVIATLWARGEQLRDGLTRAAAAHPGLHATVGGAAPVHLRMRFRDPALGPVFSEQMMRRGVLWLPDCANVMAAHTPEIIEQVIHAADDSMAALSRED